MTFGGALSAKSPLRRTHGQVFAKQHRLIGHPKMTLKTLQPHHSYSAGLRGAMHMIMDVLASATTVSVLIAMVRVEQFGPSFLTLVVLLVGTCIIPFFVLRKDEHIKLRAAIMIAGNLLGIGFTVMTLGVVATSMIATPFFFALGAAVFNPKAIQSILAATALTLLTIAGLFLTGLLQAPEITMREWNIAFGNWVVTLFITLVFCQLMILLIHSLKRSWQDTDSESSEKFSQFEALFEYAHEAIVIMDVELGHFIAANSKAEALFGMPREKLVGSPVFAEISPEYQPSGQLSEKRAQLLLKQALTGEHPTFQWTHLNAEGKEIPCEISLSRIPPFEEQLVRASIVDISGRLAEQAQREELQNRLAASQRLEAIGQLTGGVAHDFNNLLAIVLGNLELLRERTDDPSHLRLLKPSIDATLRGADLTRNMLSFARRAPLSPSRLDLNELVKETHSWTGRTLPSNIAVHTIFEDALWPVNADQSAAESALINLILNARDAMADGGALTLKTENITANHQISDAQGNVLTPGQYVMVSVHDTGIGMPVETLKRVFEPFFTTKSTGKGSGLGLSMVLGFMQQSGGVVLVHSTPEEGTVFELYFPATDSTQELMQSDLTHPEAPIITRDCRILLVEDQAEVREVLQEMLQADGHKVVTTKTADEAKTLFDSDPAFDLLLTDVVMPGTLQGTTLVKSLREKVPDLPAIFMSGYASEALQAENIDPEDLRLTKPVQRSELQAAIAQTISGAKAS